MVDDHKTLLSASKLVDHRTTAEFPWLHRLIRNWQNSTVNICSQHDHNVTNLYGNFVDNSLRALFQCEMLPLVHLKYTVTLTHFPKQY